eukprot:206827_1
MTAPPPRTLSAPHGKSQVPFSARHLHSDPNAKPQPFRAAGGGGGALAGAFANRVSPSPDISGSPTTAGEDKTMPTAGGDDPDERPAGSPSQQDAAPLPPPTSMIEEGEYVDDDPDHPEERVYG